MNGAFDDLRRHGPQRTRRLTGFARGQDPSSHGHLAALREGRWSTTSGWMASTSGWMVSSDPRALSVGTSLTVLGVRPTVCLRGPPPIRRSLPPSLRGESVHCLTASLPHCLTASLPVRATGWVRRRGTQRLPSGGDRDVSPWSCSAVQCSAAGVLAAPAAPLGSVSSPSAPADPGALPPRRPGSAPADVGE